MGLDGCGATVRCLCLVLPDIGRSDCCLLGLYSVSTFCYNYMSTFTLFRICELIQVLTDELETVKCVVNRHHFRAHTGSPRMKVYPSKLVVGGAER